MRLVKVFVVKGIECESWVEKIGQRYYCIIKINNSSQHYIGYPTMAYANNWWKNLTENNYRFDIEIPISRTACEGEVFTSYYLHQN